MLFFGDIFFTGSALFWKQLLAIFLFLELLFFFGFYKNSHFIWNCECVSAIALYRCSSSYNSPRFFTFGAFYCFHNFLANGARIKHECRRRRKSPAMRAVCGRLLRDAQRSATSGRSVRAPLPRERSDRGNVKDSQRRTRSDRSCELCLVRFIFLKAY